MANPIPIILHASAQETADGSGVSLDLGSLADAAVLTLVVSAATALLAVTLQASPDGATGWRDVDAFPSSATPSRAEQSFIGLSRFVRVRWTLSASPATFAVSGLSHQSYITRESIRGALPDKAIESVPKSVIADAIIKASSDLEDALNSGFSLPASSISSSMVQRGAEIAAFRIMKYRGFQPQGSDELIVKAYDDARGWLALVAKGTMRPAGVVDAAPEKFKNAARVTSANGRRGW